MNAVRHLADGSLAEDRALDYLAAHGLTLFKRNYRCRAGEIDLVMLDGGTLVIVEVRFRRDRRFGGAAGSVDRGKQRRLRAAALYFLGRHPHMSDLPVRFDVIAIDADPAAGQIEWIRNAFFVEDR